MSQHINKMIEGFSGKLTGKFKCPWNKNLFKVDEKSLKLPQKKMKTFHTIVMKRMFSCQHARQDMLPNQKN